MIDLTNGYREAIREMVDKACEQARAEVLEEAREKDKELQEGFDELVARYGDALPASFVEEMRAILAG